MVSFEDDQNQILLCPSCKGANLHHARVDVWDRPGEDQPSTKTSILAPKGFDPPTYNPSSRRGGISIVFWCEGCSERPVLGVAQHKGSTLLRWMDVDHAKPEPKDT